MKKIIILNHKSDLTMPEIKEYLLNINDLIRNDLDIIICPSSIYIPYFIGKYKFKVASQSISDKELTGELTGNILKSVGVNYTLIGHPERIKYLNETSQTINNQIKESLKNNIIPIVFLGETYYQNEMKKTIEVISKQIREYFKDIDIEQDIILVYEPNWEYKGKQIPTIEHITEVIELIKNIILKKYEVNIKVIYGGNVNKYTLEKLEKISNIDGYVIGQLSSNLEELKSIFQIIE